MIRFYSSVNKSHGRGLCKLSEILLDICSATEAKLANMANRERKFVTNTLYQAFKRCHLAKLYNAVLQCNVYMEEMESVGLQTEHSVQSTRLKRHSRNNERYTNQQSRLRLITRRCTLFIRSFSLRRMSTDWHDMQFRLTLG